MRSEEDPHAVNFLIDEKGPDPRSGRVRADLPSIVWNGGMAVVALIVGPFFVTPSGILLFFVTTGAALLLGHSVGYHRMMIHSSFKASRWMERTLVWFGAFVGMGRAIWHYPRARHARLGRSGSPTAILSLRTIRTSCATRGGRSMPARPRSPAALRFWRLDHDPFYRWLEATWRWQQLPVALVFFAIGGWSWVVWGVAARVAVANPRHWLVGHLAHNRGPQHWTVDAHGVQAFDVPWAAIPTMGEAWHNNHHAYPGSARIGLHPGQSDWGYAFIALCERVGLISHVQTPATLGVRNGLEPPYGTTRCRPPSSPGQCDERPTSTPPKRSACCWPLCAGCGGADPVAARHGCAVCRVRGTPLTINDMFWLFPIRQLAMRPDFPRLATIGGFAFCLAISGILARLSLRRADRLGRGGWLALATMIPTLQILAVLALALLWPRRAEARPSR